MEERNNINEDIHRMTDEMIVNCISQGKDSYRGNIYDLYLNEAEKRDIKIDFAGLEAKKLKKQESQETRDIVKAYFLAIIPFTGMFYFYILSFRLLKHLQRKKIIENNRKLHVIIQWSISIFYGLLLLLSIVGIVFLLTSWIATKL